VALREIHGETIVRCQATTMQLAVYTQESEPATFRFDGRSETAILAKMDVSLTEATLVLNQLLSSTKEGRHWVCCSKQSGTPEASIEFTTARLQLHS